MNFLNTVLNGLAEDENATLLERTAPQITVPSHIVWGQEDQVRLTTKEQEFNLLWLSLPKFYPFVLIHFLEQTIFFKAYL